MPSGFDTYKTPLEGRYASDDMKRLFSQRSRHSIWRKLWLWLAISEKELGIETITDDAIEQMKAHLTITDDDFVTAAEHERILRHDVMAHINTFGEAAPAAKGIIHLGATSCYVTDNTELILMRDGMDILLPKLAKVLHNLQILAIKYKALPTLGYTHYQPAQMITVGKRAAYWAEELLMDLENIEHVRQNLRFRGAQGTTGTQASFMEIFKDDAPKIDRLNEMLCERAGFPACYHVSVQTYTRKVDLNIANAICGLGATVQRITADIRHLANMKEMEEPFEKDQVGSSAMAYKRNPMRCERIASLGRKLASLPANFSNTFSSQWMERSLDDSAIRRIDIPEMFLLADAILVGMDNVTSDLKVYAKRIHAHNMEELPFMATENLIMKLVACGGSRHQAHKEIRDLSMEASAVVKEEGGKNDLIARIKATQYFQPIWADIDSLLDPALFIGRSVEIVERFCGKGGVLDGKLEPYRSYIESSQTAQLSI